MPSSVIEDFNQYNEDYYVEAIHYSSGDPMNLDEAILKFNVDISAGTLPDIVLMNRNIQTNDYITK
ncbi:MAG: hypothetical protein LBC96_05630, partial [Lachnospiraceae bacterium]|nr:hypothetical protein [Lachnospiraceae bacterium]